MPNHTLRWLSCYTWRTIFWSYGFWIISKSEEERSFGANLYEEFRGWIDFSKSTFALFVRELLSSLRDANQGYS